MQLIVGLGNPGDKYRHTRHNIGFIIVEALAQQMRLTFATDGAGTSPLEKLKVWFGPKPLAETARGTHVGHPFVLVKPQTFMNRSGQAVVHYLQDLSVTLSDLLIIYDDISLPLGTIRLRKKGGAGGHNGLQNIIDHLGTSDFPRMRIGIGADFVRGQQVDYVLAPFAASEQPMVNEMIEDAANATLTYMREGIDIAMNRYNRRT